LIKPGKPPVQGFVCYIFVAQLPPFYHIQIVNFQHVRQQHSFPVLPKVEAGMVLTPGKHLKIDYVDGYYFGQLLVIFPGVKAFGKLAAPVKEASRVHVVHIAELNLDVDFGSAPQHRPDIKDAGLVAKRFRDKGLVFDDFDGS
jgi:hypothetical protein